MAEQPELELAPAINAGQVAGIIIFLILIIIGAYFLTKYVGHRAMTRSMRTEDAKKRKFFSFGSGSGKNEFVHMVNVVDRIPIDRDKTLMVVEFAEKRYLIGTTPDGFEKIDAVPVSVRTGASRRTTDAGGHAKAEDSSHSAQSKTAQSPLSDSTTTKANVNAKENPSAEKAANSLESSKESCDSSEESTEEPEIPAGFDATQSTFGQRFKQAFGIVLRSYLPKSMRSSTPGMTTRSFDEELKARMRADAEEDEDTDQ